MSIFVRLCQTDEMSTKTSLSHWLCGWVLWETFSVTKSLWASWLCILAWRSSSSFNNQNHGKYINTDIFRSQHQHQKIYHAHMLIAFVIELEFFIDDLLLFSSWLQLFALIKGDITVSPSYSFCLPPCNSSLCSWFRWRQYINRNLQKTDYHQGQDHI